MILVCSGTTVVTLPAGGSFVVEVTATPTATGTFDNPRADGTCAADPTGADLEIDETNNACADSITVPIRTDLSLAKSDSADPVTAGQTLTYTLTVTNNGPMASTGSSISDPLPAGTSFVSSPDGCAENAGTVTCPIGALGIGAQAGASFTVTVGAGVTGALSNTATVAANDLDENSGNDAATEGTAVSSIRQPIRARSPAAR